ncbi:MAG: hypothetical protein ACQEWZ_07825 [Pseudomonadota bacterium]
MVISLSFFCKLFLVMLFLSPFTRYFIEGAVWAYGPILISIVAVFFVAVYKNKSLKIKDLFGFVMLIPFSFFALSAYLSNPLDGQYISAHFVAIAVMPFVAAICILLLRTVPHDEYSGFLVNLLFLFLVSQLVICLGQITNYVFGFGFHVNSERKSVTEVMGTFYGSSSLASVVCLCAFIVSSLERNLSDEKKTMIWGVIFFILTLAASRSAIVLAGIIFILTRKRFFLKSKKVYFFLILGASVLVIFVASSVNIFQDRVFDNILLRLSTFRAMFEGGVSVDGSINLRLSSYLFFLQNMDSLWLGSWKILDYHEFSFGANFDTALMFSNPHSLIVEIGYWLGWPGLISLGAGVVYLSSYSRRPLILALVLIISSSIPSSVLGNIFFMALFVLSFFTKESPSSSRVVGTT